MGHLRVLEPSGYCLFNYPTTSGVSLSVLGTVLAIPVRIRFQLLPAYIRAVLEPPDRNEPLSRAIGIIGRPEKTADHMLRWLCPTLCPGPARVRLPLELGANTKNGAALHQHSSVKEVTRTASDCPHWTSRCGYCLTFPAGVQVPRWWNNASFSDWLDEAYIMQTAFMVSNLLGLLQDPNGFVSCLHDCLRVDAVLYFG